MTTRALGPAVLLLIVAASAASAQPRPFTVRDLVAMDRISSPVASPDGTRVVYVVSALDLDANRRRTDLWIVDIDGNSAKRLTDHPASDSSPLWSRDGKFVWFLSTRTESSQVFRVSAAGGEPEQMTKLPFDVNAFALAPDEKRVVVSMDVFVDCATLACTSNRLAAVSKRAWSAKVYDRLFVRHWDTWKDGRRAHLFIVTVPDGLPVDLMQGMDADTPSKPFGGAEEFTFTPDGRSIIFTARDSGKTEAWSTDFDLYLTSVDGKGGLRSLTSANKAWDTSPTFAPLGRQLAYLAMSRPGYESDKFRIMVQNWPAGEARPLTEGWDRSPSSITWSADGRTLFATADDLGQHALFAIDATSGAVKTLIREGHVVSPTVTKDRVVVAIDHLKSPADLFTIRADGSARTRITNGNADRLANLKLGEPEQFTFPGWNGETVHGYVVRPVDFDPGARYPVAFIIHGGPQSSMGNTFHYRWNPQTYAAAGYGAVIIDFHGSTGYGQKFTDSIAGDWGGKPLEDLQKGLDAALARYSWLDGQRACALGASYGGYMINWIAGNWPERFRCLVNHDGNLDERFAYFATEELWFPEWEHGGTPWEKPENYSKQNPIDHVDKWKTPMLVIHSANDFRVVDTQGLATFTALQRRNIPSRLVFFPDESHWVLKPANSIYWHEVVLDWLGQFLGAGRASSRP